MPIRTVFALLCLALASAAPAQQRNDTALPPPPTLRDRADVLGIVFPTTVSQGAMVIGKVPTGSMVRYAGRELRVTPYGSVVFGVGRDEDGPLRVEVQPRDQLPVPLEHRGDEEVHLAVLGASGVEQLLARGGNCLGVAETEPHEAALGLVGDGRAAQLHDHGEPDVAGGGCRLSGGRPRSFVREADAMAGEHAGEVMAEAGRGARDEHHLAGKVGERI